MLTLTTLTKLRWASVLSFVLSKLLLLLGRDPHEVRCRRHGVNWILDLREGIDLSLFLFGRFEITAQRAIFKMLKSDWVVLDIGANIGSYALPMALHLGAGGKLYAVEPTQWAFKKLERNLKVNPELESRVQLFQMGILREASQKPSSLISSWDLEDFKKGSPVTGGQERSTDGARFISLDRLCEELKITKLDFIKIDVDGFEYEVLASGMQTLKTFRPILHIEVCPRLLEIQGAALRNLVELMSRLGYSFFTQTDRIELPKEADAFEKTIPKNGSFNIFMIPGKNSLYGSQVTVGAKEI